MLKDELPKIVTQTVPGPKAAAVLARRRQAIPDAIGTIYPTVIQRGEGAMFEDVDGNYFLDWVGGVGVLNISYSQTGSRQGRPGPGREVFPRHGQHRHP